MHDSSAKQPPAPSHDKSQLGKLALEFGPLAVFFVVNSQVGRLIPDPSKAIFWGTGAFMFATAIALVSSRLVFGRVPIMPLISGFFVLVFGGLTLMLQDELFIKMKPTIVNALFAVILLIGLWFDTPLLKYLFGEVFRLTEDGWKVLTKRWALFFVGLALVNEIVWRTTTTDFWVGFKLFGILPLTIIFAVAQVGLLKRYELPRQAEAMQ